MCEVSPRHFLFLKNIAVIRGIYILAKSKLWNTEFIKTDLLYTLCKKKPDIWDKTPYKSTITFSVPLIRKFYYMLLKISINYHRSDLNTKKKWHTTSQGCSNLKHALKITVMTIWITTIFKNIYYHHMLQSVVYSILL